MQRFTLINYESFDDPPIFEALDYTDHQILVNRISGGMSIDSIQYGWIDSSELIPCTDLMSSEIFSRFLFFTRGF